MGQEGGSNILISNRIIQNLTCKRIRIFSLNTYAFLYRDLRFFAQLTIKSFLFCCHQNVVFLPLISLPSPLRESTTSNESWNRTQTVRIGNQWATCPACHRKSKAMYKYSWIIVHLYMYYKATIVVLFTISPQIQMNCTATALYISSSILDFIEWFHPTPTPPPRINLPNCDEDLSTIPSRAQSHVHIGRAFWTFL